MLPFPVWKPEGYPPSDSFPLFGSGPGQLPPQFKASQHLQAMMARNKPVQDIMKDRANRDFPQHTPYRSLAPSEASDGPPPLEEVGDPEPAPLAMQPYHAPPEEPMPQENGLMRRIEVGGRIGLGVGNVAGHLLGGSLAATALVGGLAVGVPLGMASLAGHIYRALPGPSSGDSGDEGSGEVTPPTTAPTRARRRLETAGPAVRERILAIEDRTQAQPEAQPQPQRPEHFDISDPEERRADPPTVRSSGRQPGMGGFFGGLFGRPAQTVGAF